MKILGVDYGRKKIGLAVADTESKFAEPLTVIRFENREEALKKISQIAEVSQIEKVVLGVSEGKMASETEGFGILLKKKLGVPVLYQDETLTTHDAQEMSIKARIKRKKRREMEDAYSATLILQEYLTDI